MSNVISLTVPRDDEAALVAGATMLLTLAGKIPAMELLEVRDQQEKKKIGEWSGVLSEVRTAGEDFKRAMASLAEPDDGGEPGYREPDLPADPTADTDDPNCPELDADGLPWDARIHSGGKVINEGDGLWRKKRGVDQADYDRVVEELKQLMAVPVEQPEHIIEGIRQELTSMMPSGADVPPPPAPTPGPDVVEVGPFYWIHPESESYGIEQTREGLDEVLAGDGMAMEVDLEQYEAAAKKWAADAPPPPPVPAPAADEPVPETFPQFLKAITAKINAKELTMDQVNAALPEGVVNLQALGANRPDLIPSVWAKLP